MQRTNKVSVTNKNAFPPFLTHSIVSTTTIYTYYTHMKYLYLCIYNKTKNQNWIRSQHENKKMCMGVVSDLVFILIFLFSFCCCFFIMDLVRKKNKKKLCVRSDQKNTTLKEAIHIILDFEIIFLILYLRCRLSSWLWYS